MATEQINVDTDRVTGIPEIRSYGASAASDYIDRFTYSNTHVYQEGIKCF